MQEELMLVEYLQNLMEVEVEVGGLIYIENENENIVKKNKDKISKVYPEDVAHGGLEC